WKIVGKSWEIAEKSTIFGTSAKISRKLREIYENYRKLNVSGRVEATLEATRLGIVNRRDEG
ncbi:hypothetical protein, partial [Alloalcanivorax venustensis]|uniref:hypothetical protein n=1 Tax=Alloalcanivorax venustensis TaxID=172371 RepID=UPI003C583B74